MADNRIDAFISTTQESLVAEISPLGLNIECDVTIGKGEKGDTPSISHLEEQVQESVDSLTTQVTESIGDLTQQVNDSLDSMTSQVNSSLDNMTSQVNSSLDNMTEQVDGALDNLAQQEGVWTSNENQRIANENDRKSSEIERERSESARETKEQAREVSEQDRKTKESQRLASETTRVAQEEERENNEIDRQIEEEDRVVAETTRVSSENTRIANENSRKSEEGKRNTQETKRQDNEQIRINSEGTRETNESIRKTQETARAESETARKTSEQGRIAEESKRVANEQARISEESKRVAQEGNRVSSENVRNTQESARVKSEDTRKTEEQKRTTSESERVASESSRKTQESSRVNAESTRTASENTRVSSENTRKTNETSRISSEASRTEAENSRVANESARKSSETSRQSSESSRINEENNRKQSESLRIVEENIRIQNEIDRGLVFDNIETDANIVATEMRELIDGFQTGDISTPEIMAARVDSSGVTHSSIGNRMLSDHTNLEEKVNTKASIGGSLSQDFRASTLTIEKILPARPGAIDLGDANNRFRAMYVDEAYLSTNTLYLGDTPILGTNQDTVMIKADPDQSINMKTSGVGTTKITSNNNVEMSTSGMNANVVMQATGDNSQVNMGATAAINLNAPSIKLTGETTVDNMTIKGNLNIQGSMTSVETSDLLVKDNMIEINKGETGDGVSAGKAGIRINRGQSSYYNIMFDENDDLFKVGLDNSLETIATRPYVDGKVVVKADKAYVDGELAKKSDNHSHPYAPNNHTSVIANATTLGHIKSGGDLTIDANGIAQVNDNSHNHTIANVSGLQTELNTKATTSYVNAELDKKAPTHSHPYEPVNANIQQHIASPHVSLGETSATAYRGDRGKIAYDHSQVAHAPSSAQKNSDITKAEIEAKLTGTISTHTHNFTNLALGETSTTAYRGDRGKIAYDHSQVSHAPASAQKNSDITKAEIEAKLTGGITSHTHSYLPLSGGSLTGNMIFSTDSKIEWNRNTDWARIYFKNTGDTDSDSYMHFVTGDNGNEYFKFSMQPSSSLPMIDVLTIKQDHLRFKNNPVYHTGNKPTKSDVGLPNVDNTADSAKNVLSATKFTTPRKINGIDFDGTKDIVVSADSWEVAYKEIPSNADLNNYVSGGHFSSGADGNSTTILNRPPGTLGFALEVREVWRDVSAKETKRVVQVAHMRNVNEIYVRSREESLTWSGWKHASANTWRGIQDNLTSSSTTESLSANQGKVLKGLVDGKSPMAGSSNLSRLAGSVTMGDGGGMNIVQNTGDWWQKLTLNDTGDNAIHKFVFSERQGSGDYVNLFSVDGYGEIYSKNRKVYHTGNKPTPADIGAAPSSHGTHVTYGGNGSASSVSRSDHSHTPQTTITGNAATATKLQTPRTINDVAFDGSANITVTARAIGGLADESYKMKGKDLRSTNETPQWYLTNHRESVVYEFKHTISINLYDNFPEVPDYGEMSTYTSWGDSSGGLPVQLITCNTGIYYRTALNTTTWNAWNKLATTSDVSAKVSSVGSIVANRIATFNDTTGKVIKDSGFTIATSVPSGAKFTDTIYTHPTSTGNKHIPSGGANGQFLGWASDGVAKWVSNPNTWRGIQDNLTSTATDQSLSANQGRILKGLVDNKAPNGHGLGTYAATVNNVDTELRTKSGFYNGDRAVGAPDGGHTWKYYFNAAHTNQQGYNGTIAMDFDGGVLAFRAVSNGVTKNWNYVYHTGNKPTAADIGAAASSHTHSYLPLTGGTITGSIRYSGAGYDGNAISFKNGSANGAGMAIGAGGYTVIGSGESAITMLNNNTADTETLALAADQTIVISTGMQDGYASRKESTIDANGNLVMNGSLTANKKVKMEYNSTTESLDFIFV